MENAVLHALCSCCDRERMGWTERSEGLVTVRVRSFLASIPAISASAANALVRYSHPRELSRAFFLRVYSCNLR